MARLWPDHCPADSGLSVCTNSRRVAAWSTAWHCQLTCSVVQYLSATVRAESFSCLWLNPSEAKLSNVLSRQKKVTGAPPPGTYFADSIALVQLWRRLPSDCRHRPSVTVSEQGVEIQRNETKKAEVPPLLHPHT